MTVQVFIVVVKVMFNVTLLVVLGVVMAVVAPHALVQLVSEVEAVVQHYYLDIAAQVMPRNSTGAF